MNEIEKATALEHWIEALKAITGNIAYPDLNFLLNLIEDSIEDTSVDIPAKLRVQTGLDLSEYYLSIAYPDKALAACCQALENEKTDSEAYELHSCAGTAALSAGLAHQALDHLKKAISLFELLQKPAEELPNIFRNTAKAYKMGGSYWKAIDFLRKCMELCKKESVKQESLLRVNDLIELGSIYRDMGAVDTAQPFLDEAVSMADDLPDQEPNSLVMKAIALTNLGLVHSDQHDYDRAIVLQGQALQILEEASFEYPSGLAQIKENLGIALGNSGLYDEASGHLSGSLEIHRHMGNPSRQIALLLFRAELYGRQKKNKLGLHDLETANELAKTVGEPRLIGQVFSSLAFYQRDRGDLETANASIDKAISILESSDQPALLAKILELQAEVSYESGDEEKMLAARCQAADTWRVAGHPRAAYFQELIAAESNLNNGHLEKAESFEPSIIRLTTDSKHGAYAFYVRATIEEARGQQKKAIEYLRQAVQKIPEGEQHDNVIFLLLKQGSLLLDCGDKKEAISICSNAFLQLENISDEIRKAQLWEWSLPLIEELLPESAQTIVLLHQALRSLVSHGRQTSKAVVHFQLGRIYCSLKNHTSSLDHLLKASPEFLELENRDSFLRCQYLILCNLINLGSYDLAFKTGLETIQDFIKKKDFISASECYWITVQAAYHGGSEEHVRMLLKLFQQHFEINVLKSIPDMQLPLILLQLKLPKEVSRINWEASLEIPALQKQRERMITLIGRIHKEEAIEELCNIILEAMNPDTRPDDHRQIWRDTDLFGAQAAELWRQGLASKTGWTTFDKPKVRIRSALDPLEIQAEDEPELRAIKKLVFDYHEQGVWEDPNLALIEPIIENYTCETRFGAKVLINPSKITDGYLHMFFFRSDPDGQLPGFLNSCVYTEVGHVIFCPLPFMERLTSLMNLEIVDSDSKIKDSEGKEIMPVKELNDMLAAGFNRFLLEWVIAHEIGHAVLSHPAPFLNRARSSKAIEMAADNFFVERIADLKHGTEIWISISNVFIKLFHDHFKREYGLSYTGEGQVTEHAEIHIKQKSKVYPPLLARLLNLVFVLLERYPDVDQSGYFERVKKNIHIIEETE